MVDVSLRGENPGRESHISVSDNYEQECFLKQKVRCFFFFMISVYFFSGCTNSSANVAKNLKTVILESEIYSRYVSIHRFHQQFFLFYADEASVCIKNAIEKAGKWEIQFLDRVDTDERINPVMGKHQVILDEALFLYYLDYQTEEKAILKVLSKEKEEIDYRIDSLNVKCNDFFLVEDEKKTLFYKDDILKAAVIDQKNRLSELDFDSSSFSNLKEFQVFKTLDYYTLIYTDTDGGLFLVRLKPELQGNRLIVESLLQVDDSALLFHTVYYDNDVSILYYTKDYLLSYFRGGSVTKIGYYSSISALHINYINNRPVFLLSTPEKEVKSQTIYSTYLIYSDSKKRNRWHEERLTFSEAPCIAMDSLITDDSFYLLLSNNMLQLFSFPIKSL